MTRLDSHVWLDIGEFDPACTLGHFGDRKLLLWAYRVAEEDGSVGDRLSLYVGYAKGACTDDNGRLKFVTTEVEAYGGADVFVVPEKFMLVDCPL